MNVNLSKEDILRLIKGTSLTYEQIDYLVEHKMGTYTGGFADNFYWAENIKEYKINILWDLYKWLKKK